MRADLGLLHAVGLRPRDVVYDLLVRTAVHAVLLVGRGLRFARCGWVDLHPSGRRDVRLFAVVARGGGAFVGRACVLALIACAFASTPFMLG